MLWLCQLFKFEWKTFLFAYVYWSIVFSFCCCLFVCRLLQCCCLLCRLLGVFWLHILAPLLLLGLFCKLEFSCKKKKKKKTILFHVRCSCLYLNTVLILINSYVLSFSLGAGPVPALLLPEIFASRIRAKAVSLSLGMHWVSGNRKCIFFLKWDGTLLINILQG